MAQSNQNENVMKIEINYYEIFQNDVFMEEETLLKTSQGNESLRTQLNTVSKSDQESVNEIFQVFHAWRLFWNLLTKMHSARPFMLSMTIHK
jgi:hypothetical protein